MKPCELQNIELQPYFWDIANTLFMKKTKCNPLFLHIFDGIPHFLSHFKIPDYIADHVLSQNTTSRPTWSSPTLNEQNMLIGS